MFIFYSYVFCLCTFEQVLGHWCNMAHPIRLLDCLTAYNVVIFRCNFVRKIQHMPKVEFQTKDCSQLRSFSTYINSKFLFTFIQFGRYIMVSEYYQNIILLIFSQHIMRMYRQVYSYNFVYFGWLVLEYLRVFVYIMVSQYNYIRYQNIHHVSTTFIGNIWARCTIVAMETNIYIVMSYRQYRYTYILSCRTCHVTQDVHGCQIQTTCVVFFCAYAQT